MGGRDHAIKCGRCGAFYGGLNDPNMLDCPSCSGSVVIDPSPSSEQLLAEVDDFLARLLSPYAMVWNPLLRRKIKRLRKRIADV